MVRHALLIGRWAIDFLFAEDDYNVEEIIDGLQECGAPSDIIDRVVSLVNSGRNNTGFTYTDSNIYRALVVIGPTTSGSEFVNTLVHELYHLAVVIASNLGIDLESESPAYLIGDAAESLFSFICKMGCSDCRDANVYY